MATELEPTPESLAALEARLTASAAKRERWVRVLLETKIDRLKQSQRSQLEQIRGELEESRKRERELEGALTEARRGLGPAHHSWEQCRPAPGLCGASLPRRLNRLSPAVSVSAALGFAGLEQQLLPPGWNQRL